MKQTFRFLFTCLLTTVLTLYSMPSEAQTSKWEVPSKDSVEVFTDWDEPPMFPGGTAALKNFLIKNTKYPTSLQKEGIQGRVLVSFIVNTNGKISDIIVVESVHPALDKEAIRVMKKMPKWSPGIVDGEKVIVFYRLPFNLKLRDKEAPNQRLKAF